VALRIVSAAQLGATFPQGCFWHSISRRLAFARNQFGQDA
jgi:hypothetical protein